VRERECVCVRVCDRTKELIKASVRENEGVKVRYNEGVKARARENEGVKRE